MSEYCATRKRVVAIRQAGADPDVEQAWNACKDSLIVSLCCYAANSENEHAATLISGVDESGDRLFDLVEQISPNALEVMAAGLDAEDPALSRLVNHVGVSGLLAKALELLKEGIDIRFE